jgi:hypothetical protein
MDPMMMNDEDAAAFSVYCAEREYDDWADTQDQHTEDHEGETYVDLDLFFGGDR